MRIVIAGGGRVGGALAAELVAERHLVTVIDRDRSVCDRLFEEVGVVTVCGDATSARALEQAGVRGADMVAGLLPNDAPNLAFATLVRSLCGARTMVRMLDPSYREAYRLVGVDDVVSESEVVVSRMLTAVDFPELTGSMPLANGRAILFELSVEKQAFVSGKTVAQVRGDPRFPRDCVFIGFVDPEGRIELPTGSTVLRGGHTALLVARRDRLAEAVAFLAAQPATGGEAEGRFVERLRSVDILAPLSEAELGELFRSMSLVRKQAGELLYSKGEPGEELYIVLSGEVSLVDEEGRVSRSVGPGGFFGEVSLLTGDPRSAGARVEEEAELLAVGREVFGRLLLSNPSLALEMSRILGERKTPGARIPEGRIRRLFGK